MKYKYLFLIILLSILFPQCAKHNKVTCNIPPNFPEERKAQLIDIFNKGKKLYKANCSECHGIFTQGKDQVPNFTNTQLDNYSARFLRRDPKNHAVVMQMSPEQMNEILTFLKFKKIDTTAAKRKL